MPHPENVPGYVCRIHGQLPEAEAYEVQSDRVDASRSDLLCPSVFDHSEELFLKFHIFFEFTSCDSGDGLASRLFDSAQYEDGTPHDEAGAVIAEQILKELGFSLEEIQAIVSAIRGHRAETNQTILGQLIYRADKKSRNCFSCKAEPECYWSSAKKNMTIQY